MQTPETDTSAEDEVTGPLLRKARASNIDRTIYVLGEVKLGLYGRQLQSIGYSFKYVSSVSDIPDTASSIAYLVAGMDPEIKTSDLESLANYKGVLILDSHQSMNVGGRELSEKHAISPRAAIANAPVTEAASGIPDESPAADLYMKLSGGRAAMAPQGTALVTSGTARNVMPIYVADNGRVNGYAKARLEAVGPQIMALHAKQVAAGSIKPAAGSAMAESAGVGNLEAQNLKPQWDRVLDMNVTDQGYRILGRIYAMGWREVGLPFVKARKFVDVRLVTGSNDDGCRVAGFECGVYPENKYSVVGTTSTTGLGDVWVYSAPFMYFAQTGIWPSEQLISWQPRASHWTSDSALDTDYKEKLWSKGWAAGGGPGINSLGIFSLGFSGAYTSSQSYRKRTHAWIGYDNEFVDSEKYRMAVSGLQSVNRKVRLQPVNGASPWVTGRDDRWEDMSKTMLNGYHWGCRTVLGVKTCGFTEQEVPGDGSPRSSIASVGWKPAITATHEVSTNHFESASSKKLVHIKAQMGALRDAAVYTRTRRTCDGETFDVYILKAWGIPCVLHYDGVADPNSGILVLATVKFQIGAAAFSNATTQ